MGRKLTSTKYYVSSSLWVIDFVNYLFKSLAKYKLVRTLSLRDTNAEILKRINIAQTEVGGCGVMLTIVVNGHGDTSSIPEQGCLQFTLHKYLWERYESNYSPSSYLWRSLDSLALVRQPVWEKEHSDFKWIKHRLKLTLCHILFAWRGL